MSERRSKGLSASRGLATRTAGPSSPTAPWAAADTKVSVQPSDTPSPTRIPFTSRRSRE